MNKLLLEEPSITLKDLSLYRGARHFKEKKEFFYSIKGSELERDEVYRCEQLYKLLVVYNCAIYIGALYGLYKILSVS